MVPGHDGDPYSEGAAEALAEHRREARPLSSCTVAHEILPLLRQAGASDEQIHVMAVDNPCGLFEKQGAY